jgi:hypothetical protein
MMLMSLIDILSSFAMLRLLLPWLYRSKTVSSRYNDNHCYLTYVYLLQLLLDRTNLAIAFVTLIPVYTVIATLISSDTMNDIARSIMIATTA